MSTPPRDAPAARRGRPRVVTRERIVEAGIALTLEKLTVKAVAARLGITTAGLYQHIDGVGGLKRMVADEIMRRRPLPELTGTDLAADLLALSTGLRRFVHEHPGIGQFMARIDSSSIDGLARIDAVHARFATTYGLSPSQAAWLVSTVAEHAIALATVIYTPEPRPRHGRYAIEGRTDLTNLRQVRVRRPDRDDDWFFAWSMRATIVGTITMVHDAGPDLEHLEPRNGDDQPATPG